MIPAGSQKIVFLGQPPMFYRERTRQRDSTPYRRDLRRIKRGSKHGGSLKGQMRRLMTSGDETAREWFANKRRTG